jgi:hypothetical protein
LAKNNIGGALAGVTTPIIGIITIVLLYITLSKQLASYNEQRIKNECDIVLLLINQLDHEIESFYVKQTQAGKEIKRTGIEALNDFCREYRYENNIEQFKGNSTFKLWYEAGQIALLITTFQLIERRIISSPVKDKLSEIFNSKMQAYYKYKLKIPLTSLSEAFDIYSFHKDDITDIIQIFTAKHNALS